MRLAVFERHPKDLPLWIFSEFTERLCFFTIKALLAIIMLRSLEMSEAHTLTTLAMFGSYCYLTPMLGGLIADRWLSAEHAVILGGLIMAAGYVILGLPHDEDLILGLATVITGMGFYKTNLILCISRLYPQDDPRRGEAFTLFYATVDMSLLIATGLLTWAATYSWRCTFLGLSCFLLFSTGLIFFKMHQKKSFHLLSFFSLKSLLISLAAVIQMMIFTALLSSPQESHPILWITFTGVIGYYAWMVYRCKTTDRTNLLIILCFTILGILFFSFVAQMNSSLLLYIEHHMTRTVMDYMIPSPFFMIFEPIGFIILCPIIAFLFSRYCSDHRYLIVIKLTLAFACLATAFAILALVTYPFHSEASYWSIGLAILFIAAAEVFFLPSLLELTTQFAPPKIASLTVALPFLAFAFSDDLAGYLSRLSLAPASASHEHTTMIHNYFDLFCGISIASVLVMLFLIGVKLYARRRKWRI